jgi:spermidine/putrescine-binding protein
MLDPPLKDNPLAPPADSEEYLAEHAREPPARGQPNPENKPRNFIGEFLGTPNPTQKDLAPEDAIGKSFLMPPEDDGTRHRARIMEIINDDQQRADERKKALIKFKCLVNDQWEEVVAYNQISDFIEQGESWVRKGNVVHKMKEIAAHKRSSQVWTSGTEGVPIQRQDHLVGRINNLGTSHESSQG